MSEDLTAEQRYLFDINGYLTLPGALNDETVQELRDTLVAPTEQWDPVATDRHPLHWGPAWRSLLDLPHITPIVEALVGNHELRAVRESKFGDSHLPTYRIDHINVHTHVEKGFAGMELHGGWRTTGGSQFFRYHDGQFYNGLIVVAYELFDTVANGGGFCCIPGSHKANLGLPENWREPGTAPAGLVKKIPARAGDAIIFTEALVHGTAPWTVDDRRQTIFYKFSPHGTSWSADFLNPDDFRGYNDMNERKLAVLESPNARYPGRSTSTFKRPENSA